MKNRGGNMGKVKNDEKVIFINEATKAILDFIDRQYEKNTEITKTISELMVLQLEVLARTYYAYISSQLPHEERTIAHMKISKFIGDVIYKKLEEISAKDNNNS